MMMSSVFERMFILLSAADSEAVNLSPGMSHDMYWQWLGTTLTYCVDISQFTLL